MEILPVGLLALFAALTVVLAQQEPQIAPHSAQQAPHGRSAPLLGARYSASTDVSHVSFNSPLVTYGDSLNDIQLPAAPIRPANLRQASQEDNSEDAGQQEREQTLVRSGNLALKVEPQSQVSQALKTSPDQQFISIQQYPARSRAQLTPRGFSLSQNLPGPQPLPATRYASQYPSPQTQPQVQHTPYASAQPQQYSVSQPQQYVPQQPQVQYPSPSSNAYFATGPFAAQYPASNLVARQYPAQPVAAQYAPPEATQYAQPIQSQYSQQEPIQYAQPVAPQYSQQGPQYAQPVAPQYAQQAPSQYAQPVASQYAQQVPAQYAQPVAPQYAQQVPAQYAQPGGYSGAPAQFVSRVAFNGPAGGFSYGF